MSIVKPPSGHVRGRTLRIDESDQRWALFGAPQDDPRAYVSYVHAVLCQVGLPRSKVEGFSFERRQRGASLLVEAGKLWNGRTWVQQVVPYGPKPRVMLADLLTYAVRRRTRVIPLEHNVTRYLSRLGWTNQGGARGPLTAFRNQAQALAACTLSLGISYGMNAHTISGKPIQRFAAWLEDRDRQRVMWPAELELTTDFYESLLNHAVPLDTRAVHALAGSALSLDVYTWLAYRLHQLDKPLFLPWKPLREQFGQEYANPKDFKRAFLDAFRQVIDVYPAASTSQQVKGGLRLRPASAPIHPVRSFTALGKDAAADTPAGILPALMKGGPALQGE